MAYLVLMSLMVNEVQRERIDLSQFSTFNCNFSVSNYGYGKGEGVSPLPKLTTKQEYTKLRYVIKDGKAVAFYYEDDKRVSKCPAELHISDGVFTFMVFDQQGPGQVSMTTIYPQKIIGLQLFFTVTSSHTFNPGSKEPCAIQRYGTCVPN